jgi:hypothetical protein
MTMVCSHDIKKEFIWHGIMLRGTNGIMKGERMDDTRKRYNTCRN